jgi:hypothetical protein
VKHLVLLCALASCIRSNEVACGDGRVCPPGNTCDDANHTCISPSQAASCEGLVDGDTCTFEGVSGTCAGGICQPLVCGDGIRTGNEACDGSDLGSATCLTAGFYNPDGLACTAFCTFDTSNCVGRCGDGIIDGPELCDGSPPDGTCISEGLDAGPLACSASCGASLAGCARFGWVAEPVPLSMPSSITGTSDDDLWVVGVGGVALHFNGAAWTQVTTGVTDDLLRVSAAGSGDVWAIDATEVIHWNGTQWASANAPAASYTDVWATAGFAVAGTTTGVIAWDGTMWQMLGTYAGGSVVAVRGTSATDVWATDSTKVWHWNGTSWSASLTAQINSIAAVAPDDVWVSGSVGSPTFGSLIAHWNGSTWTQYASELAGLYAAITADAPNDAWISEDQSVDHFDGVAFETTLPLSTSSRGELLEMHSFGPGDIVGVSPDGVVYRYRGQSYVEWDPSVATTPTHSWMDNGDDIFVADTPGHISHWDGASWTGTTTVVDASGFVSVFGTGSDNVWAMASGGSLYRYVASAWTKQAMTFSGATALWGTGADDMWVFSAAQAGHYDGSTWSTSPLIGTVAASGSSPTDVWAISTNAISRWDGTTWTAMTYPSAQPLVGIASIGANRVVAVDTEYAYTWDGTSWSQALVPVIDGIKFVAATAPNQIIAATPDELAQFDGTEWAPMRLPGDQTNNSLAAIDTLMITPNTYAMTVNLTTQPFIVRGLLRTKPWVCEATETECGNGVDDDCDGLIDALDPDCQH